jgi:hypothetical protein
LQNREIDGRRMSMNILVIKEFFTKYPESYINYAKNGDKIIILDGDVELVLTKEK